MRGVIQEISGDPATLHAREIPMCHEPGPRDVLIRVQFAALNRADLLMAKGGYPGGPKNAANNVLGLEISGTVVAVGEECTSKLEIGDNVMALVSKGGYAEFCMCDERTVIKAFVSKNPDVKLDMSNLAAVPEAYMTAYQLCFFVGKVQPGETVLLHAAASSVGLAAIQMLVRKGVRVIATARTDEKVALCVRFGAHAALNLRDAADLFAPLVRAQNGGELVDAVLDPVGQSYLTQNVEVTATDGRIIIYGAMSGSAVTDTNFLRNMLTKRVQLLTSTLKTRTTEYKHELIRALQEDKDGFACIVSGEYQVLVDRVFPLEQVKEAHAYMASNQNIGKILLSVSSTTTAIQFFEKELEDLQKRLYINPHPDKKMADCSNNRKGEGDVTPGGSGSGSAGTRSERK